jgi:dUTP pyrophosphatase
MMERIKMSNFNIQVKKLSENAKIPTQGSKFAAGYDLYAAENAVVYPKTRFLVKTNIVISIPEGFYGRIAPRSGLAYKNGIDILAGVIDSDYRGDVGVILYNSDACAEFEVKKGDRIAQIIFERCMKASFEEVKDLESSVRSVGGFGSTGI